jgi:hypothetical protein
VTGWKSVQNLKLMTSMRLHLQGGKCGDQFAQKDSGLVKGYYQSILPTPYPTSELTLSYYNKKRGTEKRSFSKRVTSLLNLIGFVDEPCFI